MMLDALLDGPMLFMLAYLLVVTGLAAAAQRIKVLGRLPTWLQSLLFFALCWSAGAAMLAAALYAGLL